MANEIAKMGQNMRVALMSHNGKGLCDAHDLKNKSSIK